LSDQGIQQHKPCQPASRPRSPVVVNGMSSNVARHDSQWLSASFVSRAMPCTKPVPPLPTSAVPSTRCTSPAASPFPIPGTWGVPCICRVWVSRRSLRQVRDSPGPNKKCRLWRQRARAASAPLRSGTISVSRPHPLLSPSYAGDGESQQVDLQQDQRGERLVE